MDSSSPALARKKRLKLLLDENQRIENLISQQSALNTLEAINSSIVDSNSIIAEGSVQERAENTSEVVMDAQLMLMNHNMISKVMEQNSEFNESMYQNAICRIVFKDDNVNWEAMENITCTLPLTIRSKPTMLGVVDITPKEHIVKERQQRKPKTSLGATTCPLKVDNVEREDKGAKKIEFLYDQLKELLRRHNQPIPYFKLIIDPHNLMNTVENAFQLSFLVRDNCIAIDVDEEGYPLVRLTTAEERRIEKDAVQTICTLNVDVCKVMIERYNIKNPMLKVRHDDDEDEDDGD